MKNSDEYCKWLKEHNISGKKIFPMDGFFKIGNIYCFLPYLMIYWKGANIPEWLGENWTPLPKSKNSKFIKYADAVGVLDILWRHSQGKQKPFIKNLRKMLQSNAWLVALPYPTYKYTKLLEHRIEAIYLSEKTNARDDDTISSPGELSWSRDPSKFPNELKPISGNGIDLIHTPENQHAGLVRYIGHDIDLSKVSPEDVPEAPAHWSPSTINIPYRLSNAPRRLMLGAGLQLQAVPLEKISEQSIIDDSNQNHKFTPFGTELNVIFSLFNGFTHEDAIVISENTARKMTMHKIIFHNVKIPWQILEYEIIVKEGDEIQKDDLLIRGWIDIFALGFSYPEVIELQRHYKRKLPENTNSRNVHWLEIEIPGARASFDGVIKQITVSADNLSEFNFRYQLTFEIESKPALRVGDKLATPHGIKGVISKILPAEQMPILKDGNADIIISPAGIYRRGAMGQFREAAAGEKLRELPRQGKIFVMRQPQNVTEKCSALGKLQTGGAARGQRFGWMEFLALISHGAESIATELLSLSRSTANWIKQEALISESQDYSLLATQAINRFLSVIGAKIEDLQLKPLDRENNLIKVDSSTMKLSANCFRVKVGHSTQTVLDHLSDVEWWRTVGGCVVLDLDTPLLIKERLLKTDSSELEFEFNSLILLPPWYRPDGLNSSSKLTEAYDRLLRAAEVSNFWKEDGYRRWWACFRLCFSEKVGLGNFVHREILGRRLTRSGRAVIVPDPTLRVDQVRLPAFIQETIFDGLSEEQRQLVLIGRNPTLHRRGLLALRPTAPHSENVIALPLGLLSSLGADFDGDQAFAVALENADSISEAKNMLPGASASLRIAAFRKSVPAFPLQSELSWLEEENLLHESDLISQEQWCEKYDRMLRRSLERAGDGWNVIPGTIEELEKIDREKGSFYHALYNGESSDREWEKKWLQLARAQMQIVYDSVRMKGRLGGVLRRQFYHLEYKDKAQFQMAVEACQTVTERMTQQALSVKSGAGIKKFQYRDFFKNPFAHKDALLDLEETFMPEQLAECIGNPVAPEGLLKFLLNPLRKTIFRLLMSSEDVKTTSDDLRIKLFLS